MKIDEDTSAWLGCPTLLEMYKHQCALLEDELMHTQLMLQKARVKFVNFLIASSLAVASIGVSYVLIPHMRTPETQGEGRLAVNPTDSFEDMNYNAVFISEDVLSAIKSQEI